MGKGAGGKCPPLEMRRWVFVTVTNCTLLLCSSGTIVQGAAAVFPSSCGQLNAVLLDTVCSRPMVQFYILCMLYTVQCFYHTELTCLVCVAFSSCLCSAIIAADVLLDSCSCKGDVMCLCSQMLQVTLSVRISCVQPIVYLPGLGD